MVRAGDQVVRDPGAAPTVPALTRKNKRGVVLERTPEVQAQIQRALGLTPSDLRVSASVADHKADGYLAPECLVFLIRHYHAAFNDDVVAMLAGELVKRCTGRIRKGLRGLTDREKRDEAVTDVVGRLFEKILDLDTDIGDFMQVRFWVFLNGYTVKAFNRVTSAERRRNRQIPMDAIAGEEPDGDEDEHRISRQVGDERLNSRDAADRKTITREAMQALDHMDPRYAEAFRLKYEFDWPIYDADPDVPTISRHFGKNEKTIRNWLDRAETALERWRERAL